MTECCQSVIIYLMSDNLSLTLLLVSFEEPRLQKQRS